MKLSYSAKARLAKYLIPLIVVVPCVLVGYRATQTILAAPPAAEGIGISTDQAQYKVGQDVTVTLSNATAHNVFVSNNCPGAPLAVYRLENNTWVSVHAAANASKCAGEPLDYEIPADRSIKTDYRYWPSVFSQPGHYRIVANVEAFSQWPSVDLEVVK
ncbi:MAG TPA: immunoglobulin-like domain-containing protein [Candidatus Saccharimonadales bacterium]